MPWPTLLGSVSSTIGVSVVSSAMRWPVGLGLAKGKNSASSLGPWLVTTDEMAPYLRSGRLHVNCSAKVNDEFWLRDSDGGVSYHTRESCVARTPRDSRIVPGDVFGSGSIGEAIHKDYENTRYL